MQLPPGVASVRTSYVMRSDANEEDLEALLDPKYLTVVTMQWAGWQLPEVTVTRERDENMRPTIVLKCKWEMVFRGVKNLAARGFEVVRAEQGSLYELALNKVPIPELHMQNEDYLDEVATAITNGWRLDALGLRKPSWNLLNALASPDSRVMRCGYLKFGPRTDYDDCMEQEFPLAVVAMQIRAARRAALVLGAWQGDGDHAILARVMKMVLRLGAKDLRKYWQVRDAPRVRGGAS